ncbi:TOMM precursor leader peptide-binding protein [Argonema galeatum]|uniref:TOMM precursor leader peptide-binding protein n=1 Tax=Argonema galeatum TaxID=2942762 RepID=UPI00201140E3|nr:TOMM precursor leader peptide-binding protein [Argonema galeatum]MCL1469016.1 TOMM precursor leader peptide-binding protein [Argonema galeatum A003/A1]
MYNKPKFKSCYRVEVIESVGVFLLAESDYFLLTGRLYELLAPLLDGDRTVDDIIKHLQGKASTTELYYTLMLMEQKGYIVENDDSIPTEVAIFWDSLNVDSFQATSRLKSTKVAVRSIGNVTTNEFIDRLKSLNIQVSDSGDIAAVLTDDYLQEDLATFNQKALELQQPWILIKPVGKIIWIGPIFQPGKTGCWECLAQRLRANRPVESFIQRQKGISSTTPLQTHQGVLPSTWQTGLNIATTEIAKWIVQGENKSIEGTLITFETISLKTKNHTLVKRPQCPACGEAQYLYNREPLPILLKSGDKNFTSDGGHRSFSPEETIEKYKHHISPITGAIRSLKQIRVSETNLTNVYVAGHNFATMFDGLYFLRENLRGKSAGKGKTDIQAKASALGEAVERYSGVFQGDEIRQKGTYKEMGASAIHPNTCMNFSEFQYQTRSEWNVKCTNLFQKVPEPFDEEIEIEWTPVWSLTNDEVKYLPTGYCYYGYLNLPKPYFWADSNGSAAGNTLEEAILQGFMEVVERDSVALWWYNRIARPLVDLDSFDDPYFEALKNYYKSIDRELWVLDLTSDLNIPTFAAISRRTDKNIEDITLGFGTHFDPKVGISRALTEGNQMLPAVLSIADDGSTKYNFFDELTIEWWKTATLANQPYLIPDENVAPKVFADYPLQASDDLREDVMTCVKIAEKQGMEVLVLDQTRPDIELNVAKVIVPGMRHFWKRLAPGRLYDVPVKLGLLPESLRENQLNPFPIFF